ncbi:MAG: histidine phosphatase family protein [Thermomicrobiales bacterium]
MNDAALKQAIRDGLWQVAKRHPFVLSATLAGSFVDAPSLEGISDIDFIVVVDRLDHNRFTNLISDCESELRPVLLEAGYSLRINPTLGPLKFNEPKLAVLHLMLYSRAAHVDHVINSPFTCLDWQRSVTFCKQSLAQVYPVFRLQPRHFFGGRRGARDYLRDLRAGVISYRELICTEEDYREQAQHKPMNTRDRHEFAYHIMRFLMQNLLKLLGRENSTLSRECLIETFFRHFPEGASEFGPLFTELAAKKLAGDFREEVSDLLPRLESFVLAFETQFRHVFENTATRHIVFRHAATPQNTGAGGQCIFQGRIDPEPIFPGESILAPLAEAVRTLSPQVAYCSPLVRSRRSLEWLGQVVNLPKVRSVPDLSEIDYGAVDGRTVSQAWAKYPDLFEAWSRGEDPHFPGGENTSDVLARVRTFVRDHWESGPPGVCCSHNVFLRCLVGSTLGVPRQDWHRLRIPHLAPLTFVQTREYGLFLDLDPVVERALFTAWANAPLAPVNRGAA